MEAQKKKTRDPDKLTALETVFCREYVKLNNGTAAAQAANSEYSDKVAGIQAVKWLKLLRVQREIERLRKILEDRTLISKERILNELALMAFEDMGEYAEVLDGGVVKVKPFAELPQGATRAVKKLKEKRSLRADTEGEGNEVILDVAMEFELHDKISALKEISELQGYYPNKKIDVTVESYADRMKRLAQEK
jgi:phage terminase small subunit